MDGKKLYFFNINMLPLCQYFEKNRILSGHILNFYFLLLIIFLFIYYIIINLLNVYNFRGKVIFFTGDRLDNFVFNIKFTYNIFYYNFIFFKQSNVISE